MESTPRLMLPIQSPPVSRELMTRQGYENEAGIEAAQTACDKLTGMAQQMCYALEYGVNM
jgi:hypothetical protein